MRAFKQATNASVNSLQVDIVDYEFYLHGKYLGPLVSSVSNVLGKIFGLYFLCDYCRMRECWAISVRCRNPGDAMSNALLGVALFLWLGIPAVGSLASVIAMHWYPLSKEKMVEVQTANKARREQNAAAYEAEQAAKENVGANSAKE